MYRISTQTFRETCIAHGVDPTDALFYVLKESNRASKNDEATWIVQTPTALFFPNDLPWITGLTRDERRACVLKHIQKWIGQLDSIQTDAFVSETYL